MGRKPVSNRRLAKTLGAGESTLRRDIAPNGADDAENDSEINAADTRVAPNGAPALSGGRTAQLGDKREQRMARDQTANKNRLRGVPDGIRRGAVTGVTPSPY